MEENCKPPAKKQKVEDTVSNECEPHQSESSTLEKDGESQSVVGGCHLMEKDVGITEYMSPQRPGFFAILKQRWMLKVNPSPKAACVHRVIFLHLPESRISLPSQI